MQTKLVLSILVEQILVTLILIIHLSGFMNVSHTLSKNRVVKNILQDEIEKSMKYVPDEKLISKTVVIVIDALRVDHLVTEDVSSMEYSKMLMKTNEGIGYFLKTASPTVTLPRIKSIVTGSVPNFLDVIFNFASSELLEENVISSAEKKGLKMVFYGDDTWLKLFPQTFKKRDGVASFFVSDYTEVDNNVSRHLPDLMSNLDWDLAVLHYVGLDHIGHLEGPKSSLIAPKLKEMDGVIKMIHEGLKKTGSPFLILVCGDHGMSDLGGHGGDSHNEIWTSALVVPHLDENHNYKSSTYSSPSQRMRNQVDLASLLSIYLGVEIPSNNVGIPLFECLDFLQVDRQLIGHYRVSKQLMKLALETQEESVLLDELKNMYSKVLNLHNENWKLSTEVSQTASAEILKAYKEFELLISSILMDKMESYDLSLLLISAVILIMISLPTIIWSLFLTTDISSPIYEWKMLFVTLFGGLSLFFCKCIGVPTVTPVTYIVLVLFVYGASNLFSFIKCFTAKFYLKISVKSMAELVIVTGVVFHPFCLLATSLVEEEHFVYYFAISNVYFFLILSVLRIRLESIRSKTKTISPKDSNFIEEDLFNDGLSQVQPIVSNPVLFSAYTNYFILFNRKREKNKSILNSNYSKNCQFFPLLFSLILCFSLFRFLRAFNATGDKWKHLVHLNDLIRSSEESSIKLTIIIGLSITLFLFRSYGVFFIILAILFTLGRHFPFWEKGVKSGTLEAQCAYVCLFAFLLYKIVKIIWLKSKLRKENKIMKDTDFVILFLQLFESFFALLFLLLQKPENVLVSSLCFLHFHLVIPLIVKKRKIFGLERIHVYVLAFWIGQAHFFIQGNSNSFTTVQMSAGFVGVISYRPIVHGILIVTHTFGAKYLVLIHTLIVVLCHEKEFRRAVECLRCWWMLQLLTLTIYVMNVTFQRHHLFIWSVFAPKLLYEESHFLCSTSLTILIFIIISIAKVISKC